MKRQSLLRRTLALLAFVTLSVPGPGAAQMNSASTIATEKIFDAIGIREGLTVCEIGAGDGALTVAAAKLVGPAGRIYSSELGEGRLKALRTKVGDSGLSHITVVEGAPTATNFPADGCDAVFMRNVYHHFADPGAMNTSIHASLKPGGRLAVVDFTPPDKEAPTPAERAKDGMHGVTAETLTKELKDAGFEPLGTTPGTERWFLVVVARPASAPADANATASGSSAPGRPVA